MKRWVIGLALVCALVATASPAHAQDECDSGRSERLVRTIPPLIGQSPLWLNVGDGTIQWEGPDSPVQMLVIRDVAVNGATSLTGKLRDGTSKAGFGFATLNNPSERLRLNNLGIELDSVSEDELRKYAFHRVIVWFPEPGCYEITGQVGRERSLIYLNVVAKEG